MQRFVVALFLTLLTSHAAIAQPRADMRPSWLSEADEISLAQQLASDQRNLAAARAVIRNIAIDIFNAQPNLAPADYYQLVVAGARDLPARVAAAEALDPENDAELQRLRTLILAGTREGRLAEAERHQVAYNERFETFLGESRRRFEAQALQQAVNWENAASLAVGRAAWREAALHYARAAETAPQSAMETRWRYRMLQAWSLGEQAERFADLGPLIEAIGIYETLALPLAPRDLRGRDWASTNRLLGVSQTRLGERLTGQDSISAFEAAQRALENALSLPDSETDALLQLQTETALADALLGLGERQSGESGMRALLDARQIYARITRVESGATVDRAWAVAQMNYGIALRLIGERQLSQDAVRSFSDARAALNQARWYFSETYPQTGDIDTLSQAQINYGALLIVLARLQQGEEKRAALNEAIEAYDMVLRRISEDVHARMWALAHLNRGISLTMLAEELAGGEREGRYFEAVGSFEAALQVYRPETDPRNWVRVQLALGSMWRSLAVGWNHEIASLDAIQRAQSAYEAALAQVSPTTDTRVWAQVNMQIGNALVDRSRWEGESASIASLQGALERFRQAKSVMSSTLDLSEVAILESNLGSAAILLAARLDGAQQRAALQEAEAAFNNALALAPDQRTSAQQTFNLARVQLLAGRPSDARASAQDALRIFTQIGDQEGARGPAALLLLLTPQ